MACIALNMYIFSRGPKYLRNSTLYTDRKKILVRKCQRDQYHPASDGWQQQSEGHFAERC